MENEFDESRACAYMRQATGTDYDDDQLLNIIDIIFDYYEDNGLLDIDGDSELDTDALTAYVTRMLAKDKGNLVAVADIDRLVAAELAYEDSIMD